MGDHLCCKIEMVLSGAVLQEPHGHWASFAVHPSPRYPRPGLTVDAIIVTEGAMPEVLLIKRKNDPFAGSWALPGRWEPPRPGGCPRGIT